MPELQVVFVVALMFGVTSAFAQQLPDTNDRTNQLIGAMKTYVTEVGNDGILLDINANTGEFSKFQLVGSSTSVTICQNLSLITTNFSSASGQEIVGNFVIQSSGVQDKVEYQSFGKDDSLKRLNDATCQASAVNQPQLRLTSSVE